ncbi:CaiB/BaiF CoA-transferase family protein [Pseudovibrio sp. Tun.PSC04-5.I4]|uniref:CaiB/BaiF CoA transferase family protein n=1 Tax=Pseudovibrio sp. Tun.PSC04-5.I4 TaxID=1798213 RepID=UPI00087E329E|nr:CaiB/BaiF CoA-transferase family protein [Pseudovibrio sp. Tun.PSC04-5.I4]SDR21526.1 Crotonobetainyl-CoA:carnitine CoA-transferase CaiB [Pseudovibrio sp. Tun.PSC04-5.I4]
MSSQRDGEHRHSPTPKGPLDGLVVLDLSRILAGPTCTQLLGDMGAEIIKIEHPKRGDDTRGWGPPFLKGKGGEDTRESAYYLSSNRNKNSVGIDMRSDEGIQILKDLAAKADIVIENFKVGDLARKGLGYEDLHAYNERLIYCSITGFGQTGPYAHRAGYDALIQAMGGIMSITGLPEDGGGSPMKIGVGIADVMCGMYASTAILAALQHREKTDEGQYIDISLLDCQVAWLINQGLSYLTDGNIPKRLGNGHPTIVPYETFPATDKDFMVAVGNDAQYQRFCEVLECPQLATDPRFVTNADRVRNRAELVPLLRQYTIKQNALHWTDALEATGVPCGPVNDLAGVFSDPQVLHRGMKISMPHAQSENGQVNLIGNPINYSKTPVTYRKAPPALGEDSIAVLSKYLQKSKEEIDDLAARGIVSLGNS